MLYVLMSNNKQFKQQMQRPLLMVMPCEQCTQQQATGQMTRCCRNFLCLECREQIQKRGTCPCNKPLQSKRICIDNQQVFDALLRYYQCKPIECHRCINPATVSCSDCNYIFCGDCNEEVHRGLGFAKHCRTALQPHSIPLTVLRQKDLYCKIHSVPCTAVCECALCLCATCTKTHKEVCGRKIKPIKQFKEEYYLNIMQKLKKITSLKEKLAVEQGKYEGHYEHQRQLYESSVKSTQEQFNYLMRLLELKLVEVTAKIKNYWQQCQQTHNKNINKILSTMKSYDECSSILERLAAQCLPIDYLQKKLVKVYPVYDSYSMKLQNIDCTQSAILSVNALVQEWQPLICEASKQQTMVQGIYNVGELLSVYSQSPLKPRALQLVASHSQIAYCFLHLPHQGLEYELQYGVGIKIKGEEVFKKIKIQSGNGVIDGLNCNTKYRIRMMVCGGQWGSVQEINTLDLPRFHFDNCVYVKGTENVVQFSKIGTLYGVNQIYFGVYRWVFKISSMNNSFDQSETACMSIGVSNKENKKAVFVGKTLNYGFQKEQITLKICVNCEQKKMTIVVNNCAEETYTNLPPYPMYPTLANKGNSQVLIKYSLMTDDPSIL